MRPATWMTEPPWFLVTGLPWPEDQDDADVAEAVFADIASLLRKHQAPPWAFRHLAGARIWLTFVTVGELAKWTVIRDWGESRRSRLDAWMARRPLIPYDTEIARVWGEHARTTLPATPPGGVTAGVDWASADHVACVVDSVGKVVTRLGAGHTAAGLAGLVAGW